MKLKDINFIVVDCETTGSKKDRDRIIDVAYVVVRDGQILDEYSSLINPQRFIPPIIQKITGISNQDVFSAPEAEDILPTFRKIFELPNVVFAAHFAKFDYSFVNSELARINHKVIDIPVVDTLKLAQKLLPKNVKKNVGSMANFFGVPMINRHRALGDAKATAYSLIKLLQILNNDYLISTFDEVNRFQDNQYYQISGIRNKTEHLRDILLKLPEESGIFYLYDNYGNVLYIGSALNIKQRVNSFFSKSKVSSKKIFDVIGVVRNIKFEITKSELAANIKKHNEIKKMNPEFNKDIFDNKTYPYVKITKEKYPRVMYCYKKIDDDAVYFGPYDNNFLVDNIFMSINRDFRFRKCDYNIENEAVDECIYYYLGRCHAPCKHNVADNFYIEELGRVKQFVTTGIESELQNEMNRLSNKRDFETAAILRNQLYDFQKSKTEVASHLDFILDLDYIAILFDDDNTKINLFFIKSGLLDYEISINDTIENENSNIEKIISDVYFSKKKEKKSLSSMEMQEYYIINTWIDKVSDDIETIEINYLKNIKEISLECLLILDNYFKQT